MFPSTITITLNNTLRCSPLIRTTATTATATAAAARSLSTPTPTHTHTHTLIYPDASSSEHRDLASYAAYAARTGLDVTSKVYVGTQYEYTVAWALRALGFSARRVGGRSDCGIDLLGTWRVPSSLPPPHHPLRVLLQCKASSQRTKIGPHHMRELEGAFVGAPTGWRGKGVLAFLAAQKPATKGVRDALGRSRWPMGYIYCSPDGRLEQMLWNRRAEEEGLEGLGVAVKFSDGGEGGGGGGDGGGGKGEQRIVLTWKGKPYLCEQEAEGASTIVEPTPTT